MNTAGPPGMIARMRRHGLICLLTACAIALPAPARAWLLAACAAGAIGAADPVAALPSHAWQAVQRDSAGVTIVEHPGTAIESAAPLRLTDSPAFRIGAESGPAALQFTRVTSAVRLHDGSFAILERVPPEVRVFDASGEFVRVIGRSGGGPGEFEDPNLLVVAGEDLLVWDWRLRRLSTFGASGEFLTSIVVPLSSVDRIVPQPDRPLVVLAETGADTFPQAGVHRMKNGAVMLRVLPEEGLDTIASFAGTEWELRSVSTGFEIFQPWYFPRLLSAASADGLWISYGTAWELMRRRFADGAVDHIVRILRPPEPFDRDRIRALQQAEMEAASPRSRPTLARRHEERVYPETVPPVDDVYVDGVGRIWLARSEVPSVILGRMGRALREWVVLSPDGSRLLGRLTLPPRRRLLHADAEGVLVVTTDEFDVPYIEWWRFR